MSAIRIVDLFKSQVTPDVPIERQVIRMTVVCLFKLNAPAGSQQTIELKLERPNGEIVYGPEKIQVVLSAPLAGDVNGITAIIPAAVIPKQDGQHFWVALLNGKEVAIAPFTLVLESGVK